MILNTLKRYDHTARILEDVYQGAVVTAVPRETIRCNVRLLNKLGYAEIRVKELLKYNINAIAFDSLRSRSGQLVFPLSAQSEVGRSFSIITVTPSMDPFGDLFEWVYTVKHG